MVVSAVWVMLRFSLTLIQKMLHGTKEIIVQETTPLIVLTPIVLSVLLTVFFCASSLHVYITDF